MFEKHLINSCSPTLASLKSGSLFTCRIPAGACIEDAIEKWNSVFSAHGISMCMLRQSDRSALIYVYRTTALARTLSDPEVQNFLDLYGYESRSMCDGCTSTHCSIERCLDHLKARLSTSDAGCAESDMSFPHEIGVFLGYPLQDVIGFIENKGRNCKYTGTWKVYGDKESSVRLFEKYRKCSDVYGELWRSGRRSILQLTVAG